MSLFDDVARVRRQLEAHGRVSLRAIGRGCGVDGDEIEEIVEELVGVQLAARLPRSRRKAAPT